MNKDVRVATNYPNHPKIRKLEKELGAEGIKSHIFLLCSAAQYFPSGELKDLDSEDIEILAQWKGEPDHFVTALLKLKLLDNQGDHFSIHNWLRWNLFAASAPKRSEIARANAKKRWEKKEKLIQQDNAIGNANGNAPSPSPSPSPRREEGGNSSPTFGGSREESPFESPEMDEEWAELNKRKAKELLESPE